MGLVRAPQSVGAGFTEAEETHLALLDESRHGTDGVFDRHIGIDAMGVVEVDMVDAHALEARLARDRHVVGLAADPAALSARPADVAELRGNEIFVATALHG